MKYLFSSILFFFTLNYVYPQITTVPLGPDENNQASVNNVSSTTMAVNSAGIPYIFYYTSNSGKANVKRFINSKWEFVGIPNFTPSTIFGVLMTFDQNNNPIIAYRSGVGNFNTEVRKFNGTSWEIIGNLGSGIIPTKLVVKNGKIYIAVYKITSPGQITIYYFQNNSWNSFPTYFSNLYITGEFAIDSNNIPYIIFESRILYEQNINNNKINVIKLIGNTWLNVGTNEYVSEDAVETPNIELDNNNVPYITYTDYGSRFGVTVKKFNGTDWEFVGPRGLNTYSTLHPKLLFDSNNTPILASGVGPICGSNNGPITAFKFNGQEWEILGNERFTGCAFSSGIGFAIDSENNLYLACTDKGLSSLSTVYKLNKNSNHWDYLGDVGFSNGRTNNIQIKQNNKGELFVIYNDAGYNIKKYNSNSNTWSDILNNWVITNENKIFFDENNNLNIIQIVGKNITIKKYLNEGWQEVNSTTYNDATINNLRIKIDRNNSLFLSYIDENGYLFIKKLINGVWQDKIQPPFQLSINNYSYDFDKDDNFYITYRDINFLNLTQQYKKFMNNSWDEINLNGHQTGIENNTKIFFDYENVLYILTNESYIEKFEGDSWTNIGNLSYKNANEYPFINLGSSYGFSYDVDKNGVTYLAHEATRIWASRYSYNITSDNLTLSKTLKPNTETFFSDSNGKLILRYKLNESISNAVNVNAKVWIENSSDKFVKRHFEIEPTNIADLNSQGKVTLLVSQNDFDNYNSSTGPNELKLPNSPTDNSGISNLMIYHKKGISNNQSGLPNSYPFETTIINPNDQEIFWNQLLNHWEITLDVDGFGGFFIGNNATCLTMYTLKSGNWNDPTVWSCNRIPNENDSIIVFDNNNIVLPNNQIKIKNITNNGNLILSENTEIILTN